MGVKDEVMASGADDRWWGTYSVAEGHRLALELGTFSLALYHLPGEWRIAVERDPAGLAESEWRCGVGASEPEGSGDLERYFVRDESDMVTITPVLADRPVVSRPETAFTLAARQSLTVYVSTPLWISVDCGEPAGRFTELPIMRPSDTWFGASTRVGQLCFASRTRMRHQLENLPVRPHRAISPVVIANRADTALRIERLNLPVPYLSLFASSDSALWTQPVNMHRDESGEVATLQFEDVAPDEAKGAIRVAKPRSSATDQVFSRALSAIFG